MKLALLFLNIGICFSCFGLSLKNFRTVIKEYSENSGIKMDFKKQVHLKLLKKTKNSKGSITLSKGLLSLNIENKVKSRIVFDRKNLWHITSLPDEKKPQILKIDPQIQGSSDFFLSFLFLPQSSLMKKVELISSHSKGRTWILKFKPLDSKSAIEFFSIKTDGNLILKAMIQWKNQLSTEEYIFSNIRRNQNIHPSVFKVGS